jgi:hypothetical protein
VFLRKKSTKQNFQSAQYEKNKIDKDNSKKKNHKKEKKNPCGEHCSNPRCFKGKNYKAKFSTSSILKKIKLIKTILKKTTQKKKKKKKTILEKKLKK